MPTLSKIYGYNSTKNWNPQAYKSKVRRIVNIFTKPHLDIIYNHE